MADQEKSCDGSLTKSGRAPRRFLGNSALMAAAGTSAALVSGFRAAG